MILPSKEFWDDFKSTYGAFGCAEALALMNITKDAPLGFWIELGSHKAKSSLAAAYPHPKDNEFYLVDPIYSNEDIRKEVYDKTVKYFKAILINDVSPSVIDNYKYFSFVMVDSGEHDDTVMEEVKRLEDKVIKDGIIAFHDYQNQFTAVERAYDYLLSTNKFEKIEIDWKPIFDYVRENNLEEGNVSWHEKGSMEFPCFVGAVKRV